MCGIAGEIRFSQRAACQDVNNMLEMLQPRGPDGSGLWAQGSVCLGHQRLSVIDLSEKGNQPMHDPHLGLTIVLNGCVYDDKAVRQELEKLGHRFFSTSDTEVVLRAFAQWQEHSLQRFNGMFAFAIWQRQDNSVFLARDRLGIKPLYYHHNDKGLWFSSTLPSLLKCSETPTGISERALHHYMSFRAIMGSGGLAWHQWKKHGTCSGLSARDYYRLSREAYAHINRPALLRKLTKPVQLPAKVIEQAFLEANPTLGANEITITCKSRHIQEARICLTRDLQPRKCSFQTARDCTLSNATFHPIR